MQYKIGIVEDDALMGILISERIGRGYDGSKDIQVTNINFENSTLEELIDIVYEEGFDALILDHKLNSANSKVNYEGSDIAHSIEELLYFFPIFILTSFELDAESKKNVDVNMVYEKDKYVQDEVGDYVEFINRKIFKQIKNYKQRLHDIQCEVLELKQKEVLNEKEQERLLVLDHYIEISLCGRQAVPLHLKKEDSNLQKLIDLAQNILQQGDDK
ncbi:MULTISPECIES: hypothetical protein [unclassified Bacillus cereus group]|uniref:hypothetical protein n=1 Tax=unclassified Bacillus cereus group TaxID=2750818 RepID=UPI0011EFFAD1|nr:MULTISPECIES: hypothetical protein [unclassified Bacillus cereus group]QEL71855.1 hypothetical protein DN399_27910 [Bacillus sp. AR4-2]QEL77133.1 hypothetical protein DN405_27910 [Bacillus sp. SH8-8]